MTSELEARGYRVLGTLAQGGMAELLVAERRGAAGVHKILALKRLLPEIGQNPRFVKMFRNEARIAVELQHANIVPVFEFGEADGQLFLAMDYVRGWDLSRVLGACLRRGITVPVDIALHIAIEVTKALAYAHEKLAPNGEALGLVHRDVTPGNILLSAEGEVKLADFGIARVTSSARTSTEGDVLGKLPYLSPEQARAERLDARSDLYSLGINLYEMLTGKRLFNADTAGRLLSAVRNPRVPALAQVVSGISPEVDAAVMRALAPDRDQRYPSARAMQESLSRALHVSRPAVHPSDVRAFMGTLDLPPPLDPAALADLGAESTTVRASLPPGAPDHDASGSSSARDASPASDARGGPISFGSGAASSARSSDMSAARYAPDMFVRHTPGASDARDGPGTSDARDAPGTSTARHSPGMLAARHSKAVETSSHRGHMARRDRSAFLIAILAAPALAAAFGGAFLVARAVAVPRRARLEVRCPQPGARVFVDGADRGEAPIVVEDLAPHLADVRVEAAGARPYHVEVSLTAGTSSVVDVALDPEG